MEFGITFKGFVSPDRARKLVKMAEEAGFDYCWFYDSHILWRESFVAMAMCMEHTTKMRFGPCVTNPNVRDWSVAASLYASLALQSNGRFDIGLGRGDSSMRVMGKKPANLARLTEFTHKVKAMVRGEEVMYGECEKPVKFPWATGYELPVWVGAYGPKALAVAGEHGDGVILQIGDPDLVQWFGQQCQDAGNKVERDMSDFKVQAAAPAYFGDMETCIEKTKWFPAMVGNHVADIVEKYGTDSGLVPKSLTDYIEQRRGYDYSKHGQSDNPYLDFITDDIVKSFCVLGEAEDHITKIQALKNAGTTQFNIYLDNGDEENIITRYGKEVIPAFR
ncbi:TIGR03842 family LLM class F420-dependent oxidoreductase [Alteromonas sp. KS69]|jgi:probable F420-dependent oxidoreductase|uniref:Luciferase-like monooxygenase n=1 Tax=Alteromonas naphthalenivorans TaxID=715451 RepID=F5Z5U4_ALTNA|nr:MULTISPECIES: TIGR03842 family LLM class F420-dependent oxidoreductase [Alteromonas]MBB68161.1 TIGR03842 family LLM class F420-dependent oxidoreductase [Rickettsiales bacterium]PHS60189.1 MAG: TIGR03842 family LLM class F420-dependent oxidoreductase [Alteromonas sp.]AEF05177.1 luciferase-like monooxygenase [Alteromonas naphthalenivorans]MBO7921901.1 TIGR03842 family LLM class F420-dependent oxidoreductase [Alteromonas sp. K632G]MCQ8848044.1 TIGR03842 family LLM class F420-dependent oxidored|tara:strand:- start:6087 stop:7088 length:1002 start_codon:yes stop_codon:yes gene_type:complete